MPDLTLQPKPHWLVMTIYHSIVYAYGEKPISASVVMVVGLVLIKGMSPLTCMLNYIEQLA